MKTLIITLVLAIITPAISQPATPETFKRFVLPSSGQSSFVWTVLDPNSQVALGPNTDIPEGLVVDFTQNQLTFTWDVNLPGYYVATLELEAVVQPFPNWQGPPISTYKRIGIIEWWKPGVTEDPFIIGSRDVLLPGP